MISFFFLFSAFRFFYLFSFFFSVFIFHPFFFLSFLYVFFPLSFFILSFYFPNLFTLLLHSFLFAIMSQIHWAVFGSHYFRFSNNINNKILLWISNIVPKNTDKSLFLLHFNFNHPICFIFYWIIVFRSYWAAQKLFYEVKIVLFNFDINEQYIYSLLPLSSVISQAASSFSQKFYLSQQRITVDVFCSLLGNQNNFH